MFDKKQGKEGWGDTKKEEDRWQSRDMRGNGRMKEEKEESGHRE